MTARNLVLILAAVIGLGGCSDSIEPTPAPPPLVTVAAWAGDRQTGVVGTTLSIPLRVIVKSGGAPKAGVRLTWSTAAGSITPSSSISNAAGIASATWTLGTSSGIQFASAEVFQGPSVRFWATVREGPAPPAAVVYLTFVGPAGSFISAQNGSSQPAVDTISAGHTMQWILTPYTHSVALDERVLSVSQPSFQESGLFPYSVPSTVSVTFTTPGRYRYTDSSHQYTGIIVVQ